MTSISRALGIVTICAATCTPWSALQAQAPPAATSYESGVNAYFAGRPFEAESYLSLAIEWNSQDPRAYYFRALSQLRQGQCDLARGDMLTGAMLEAQQPNRYAIGSALERVQGPNRLMLEEFRRNARLSVAASAPPATQGPAPNRTYRENETEVLREKKFVPLEELLRPEGPRTIPVEPAAGPEASAPPIPPQGGTPAVSPAAPSATPPATEPKEKDPFADDGDRAAPKAAPTPTPTPPTPPQPSPKPATPPAGDDVDPFGGS